MKAFSIYLLSRDLEFTKILKTAHRLVLENHGTRDFLKNFPNSASPQILRPPLIDVAAMTSCENNPYYTQFYFRWPSIEKTEMYFVFFFPRCNFFHGPQSKRPGIWSCACGQRFPFWIRLGALPRWVDDRFSLCVFSIRLYNNHLVKDNKPFRLVCFCPRFRLRNVFQ